eukprot:evm.model.scf_1977.2 EVM.evm.TU.scf_1977.2   scf_1977:10717-13144(-)
MRPRHPRPTHPRPTIVSWPGAYPAADIWPPKAIMWLMWGTVSRAGRPAYRAPLRPRISPHRVTWRGCAHCGIFQPPGSTRLAAEGLPLAPRCHCRHHRSAISRSSRSLRGGSSPPLPPPPYLQPGYRPHGAPGAGRPRAMEGERGPAEGREAKRRQGGRPPGREFEVNGDFRVLLVEEDKCTRRVLEQMLRQCNYKVVTASNGKEALRKLRNGDEIDLVLTDPFMPEVKAHDLLREVLRVDGHSRIPVIVMSIEERQEAILKALQAGASDYLIKPIRRNELATLWQHIWRSKQAWHKRARPAVTGEIAEDGRKGGLPENGRSRGGGGQRGTSPGRDSSPVNGCTDGRGSAETIGEGAWRQAGTSAPTGAGRAGWAESAQQLGTTAALWALAAQNGYSDGSMSSLTRYTLDRPVQNSADSQPQQQQSMLTNGSSGGLQDGMSSAFVWLSEALSRPNPEHRAPADAGPYASCGTSNLPPALQEIVAMGELQERLHSSGRATSSAQGSPLQHSRDHSAFTAVVPRSASAALQAPVDGPRGASGLFRTESREAARGFLNCPYEFLPQNGVLPLQTPESPRNGMVGGGMGAAGSCGPGSCGQPGGARKDDGVPGGFPAGPGPGSLNLGGIQGNFVDNPVLNAILAMQQNLTTHQGGQMVSGLCRPLGFVRQAHNSRLWLPHRAMMCRCPKQCSFEYCRS